MDDDFLGLAIVTRARARNAAYMRGMDDAIDGAGYCPEQFGSELLQGRYCQGYAAGRAQVASYRDRPSYRNPSRDNG